MTKKIIRSSKSESAKSHSSSKENSVNLIKSKDPSARLYLGIDQGSSSTKAVLLSLPEGDYWNRRDIVSVLDELIIPVPKIIYGDSTAEQNPEALLATINEVIDWGSRRAEELRRPLSAIGLALQRSGVLAWDHMTGQPLTNVITWADTRFKAEIEALKSVAPHIHRLTGLSPLPNFAAPKIAYLQKIYANSSVHVGTLDSFIMFRLSGDAKIFVTEDTMASRTLLYDLKCGGWTQELCRIFNIEQDRLPKIQPSFGEHLKVRLSNQSLVPITALLGDQQAAILGRGLNQGADLGSDVGAVACGNTQRGALLNLGTIASLLVNLGERCDVVPSGALPQIPQLKTNVLCSEDFGHSKRRLFIVEMTSPITGRLLLEPQNRGLCQGLEELQELCEESWEFTPIPLIKPLFEDLLQSIQIEEIPTYEAVNTDASREALKLFESLDQITLWPEDELDQLFSNQACGEVEISIADQARAVVESVGNVLNIMILIFSKSGLIDGVGRDFGVYSGSDLRGLDEAYQGTAASRSGPRLAVAGGATKLKYLLEYVSRRSGYEFDLTAGQDNGAIGAGWAAARGIPNKGT